MDMRVTAPPFPALELAVTPEALDVDALPPEADDAPAAGVDAAAVLEDDEPPHAAMPSAMATINDANTRFPLFTLRPSPSPSSS